MIRRHAFVAFAVAVISTTCQAQPERAAPFKPRLSDCTIEFSETTIKPVRIVEGWREEHWIGDVSYVLNRSVLAIARGDEKLVQHAAPAGQRWRWLTCDDKYAYLTLAPESERVVAGQPTEPPRIQWFDHVAGREAGSVSFQRTEPDRTDQTTVIVDAIASAGQLLVLTTTSSPHVTARENAQTPEYQVSSFASADGALRWVKRFESAGERPGPGAHLWASREPSYAISEIQHLSMMHDGAVVCAGPLDDIICLALANGDVRWKCERIWEYRRGFIGPSVWQHVMHRVGVEPTSFDEAQDAEAAAAFNKNYICAIVGGPIVVARAGSRETKAWDRVFVAVSRGLSDPFAGYFSDCIVYELNSNGEPIALINVPRMVHGSQFARDAQSLVWACDRNTFVRIVPSVQADQAGMGMGPTADFDCLGRIEWHRQFDSAPPAAWLVADPAGDPVAFSETHAFRAAVGGYVRSESDQVYRFPLQMISLADGVRRELTFRVPFDGKLDPPVTNFGIGLSRGIRTHGPYLMGITILEIARDRLRLTVGMQDSSCVVEFNLSELRP